MKRHEELLQKLDHHGDIPNALTAAALSLFGEYGFITNDMVFHDARLLRRQGHIEWTGGFAATVTPEGRAAIGAGAADE